jgi:hypothetical protein
LLTRKSIGSSRCPITLIQELADVRTTGTPLSAGDYAINPRGVWHPAALASEATALFITTGMGSQSRRR